MMKEIESFLKITNVSIKPKKKDRSKLNERSFFKIMLSFYSILAK